MRVVLRWSSLDYGERGILNCCYVVVATFEKFGVVEVALAMLLHV